jgi:hypothetical protein
MGRCQMSVSFNHLECAMTEDFFQRHQVSAIHDKMGSECMPQIMKAKISDICPCKRAMEYIGDMMVLGTQTIQEDVI